MGSAFQRIDTEYGPAAGPEAGYRGYRPGQPGQPAPTDRFSANRAFDKLAGLCAAALAAGIVGYFAVPSRTAYGLIVVAFVLVVVGWFRMRWARYLAPTYSVVEGLALGSVSRLFASSGHGIVLAAIAFTAGVFVAALVLYRTGSGPGDPPHDEPGVHGGVRHSRGRLPVVDRCLDPGRK